MNIKLLSLILISCALFSQEKWVIWLTGLPCSGKTTLANEFHALFPSSIILDGDDIRQTLNKDLGFSVQDRQENIRRITEMAKLVLKSSDCVVVAVVSPQQTFRDQARAMIEGAGYRFLEVYVNSPLAICIERDVKGLYKQALLGKIPLFTGVSDPYEPPPSADVTCFTDKETIRESVGKIVTKLGVSHPATPHALFIGRWAPFHKGHWAIMEAVRKEKPDRPLLIFVRNTPNEYWPAAIRKKMVENSMKTMHIDATVVIIPDIDSVNWGRDVGYAPRFIDVDAHVHAVSGTEIRRKMALHEPDWKAFLCPGVAEVIERYHPPLLEEQ